MITKKASAKRTLEAADCPIVLQLSSRANRRTKLTKNRTGNENLYSGEEVHGDFRLNEENFQALLAFLSFVLDREAVFLGAKLGDNTPVEFDFVSFS